MKRRSFFAAILAALLLCAGCAAKPVTAQSFALDTFITVNLLSGGDEQIAQVYFNVLLREDPSQEAPIDVREIWHFVRPASGDGTWKLDGIQQVENV